MLSSHVKIVKVPPFKLKSIEELLSEHYKRVILYNEFQSIKTAKGEYFEYTLDIDLADTYYTLNVTLYVNQCHS